MKILLKDSDINKAHMLYKHFTEDERLSEIYDARMKRKLLYNTDIAIAIQEGIKEGEKKGIKETNLENAKKMLIKKYPIKDIADITGLAEEEIKVIKSSR